MDESVSAHKAASGTTEDEENVTALVEELCSADGGFETLFSNILREWGEEKMVRLRDMLAERTPKPKVAPHPLDARLRALVGEWKAIAGAPREL